MGKIKDRNGEDLIKAEEIKKRWQEYLKNYTKRVLMTQITTMVGSLSYSLDTLECEAKWALGSITMIKARGGNGIPVKLFKILKNDAVKVLHSKC